MNSSLSKCKDSIRTEAKRLGVSACGFAEACEVDVEARESYARWIAQGMNGTMDYCAKYTELRDDPRKLLEGARTVIACAFNYYNECNCALAPKVAMYAWGKDYHWAVKNRLKQLGEYIKINYGGEVRACVDTAPIRERYWAQKAGIGFKGLNGQLIVPGVGSYCFIGILLWTGEIPADEPTDAICHQCMACVKACPGHALDGKGGCDARRCLSYLTIEYRGDEMPDLSEDAMIYGCDECQRVCPHNIDAKKTDIEEFEPQSEILDLTETDLLNMTPSHYRRLTRQSAMQRVPLPQLIRNIAVNKTK